MKTFKKVRLWFGNSAVYCGCYSLSDKYCEFPTLWLMPLVVKKVHSMNFLQIMILNKVSVQNSSYMCYIHAGATWSFWFY